jgi:mannose-1-phosphate guanylyltransferase
LGTPQGFLTPTAPGSPLLRPKTPFLSVASIPALATPPAIFAPSSLGDNRVASAYQYDQIREIEGFYVVIPAGGAGTRLWPLSRENHPKFLLDLTLKGRSLIQATWDRLVPLTGQLRTTVVAGPAHVNSIFDQLPELLPQNLFCEPGPKDSMAAIGLAAAVLARRDPEAVIGSFAADHMIAGDDAFLSAVTEAVYIARAGYITTIGIAPSHPSTGFGYIRLGERMNIEGAPNARMVSSFKEKPDARTAAAYIATGSYRWNAGMFVVKATVLLEQLRKYKPELADGLEKIAAAWDDESSRERVLAEVWPTLEKIPIDNAVAEPAAQEGMVAVVPATFGAYFCLRRKPTLTLHRLGRRWRLLVSCRSPSCGRLAAAHPWRPRTGYVTPAAAVNAARMLIPFFFISSPHGAGRGRHRRARLWPSRGGARRRRSRHR